MPGAADQHVVARAAEQRVVAGAAEQDVVAVAAVLRSSRSCAGRDAEASMTSSPASALTVTRSLPAIAPVTVDARGEAGDLRGGPVPVTVTTSSPLVALTMTLSAAPSSPPPVAARSAATLRDVGAGQVVDGQRVGAAERAWR